jgi:uncharacterized repeat protein (TIGR01451 family)
MLAVPKQGKGNIRGTITSASGAWMLESSPGKSGLKNRKVDLETELAGRTFECGADKQTLTPANIGTNSLSAPTKEAALGLGLPVNVRYTAHMIIDTDYEYWQKFWNIYNPDVNKTAAKAIEYLGDLIAYASIPYEREIDTNLLIQQVRLFATNSDPYSENDDFCGCDGYGKLDEVQDAWSGNNTPRTLVHFISGKTEGCGCAYTGVLCSQGNGYGTSSDIGTGFDIDDPGFMWEGMVIAHEIGHNFNSQHTHNYCNEASISDPVDVCVDNATDGVSNCLGDNNRSLPWLDSLTGGTSGAQNGTIMSYCHLQTGGFANIAHTFGEFHPYGKAPQRVPNKMLAHVVATGAACMTLDYGGSDLRVFKDCKPDDPMLVGDTATCTIAVQNYGPSMALGVTAIDKYLSDGIFSFGSITVTKGTNTFTNMCSTTTNPQNKAGTVTCNLGEIDSGHTATIKIRVTANTPQNINDRVEVSSDSSDPDTTNNTAEDEVNVREIADLEVFKDCKPDEPLLAGQTGTCTITVKNWGPSAATNVKLKDDHVSVSNGTFSFGAVTTTVGLCTITPNPQVGSGNVNCNLGNLASQGEAKIVVELLSNDPQNINDLAIASTDSYDPDNTNNSAQDGIGIKPVADLALTKTATPEPVTAGTQLTYDLEVTNNGPSTAVNVVIADVLPAGVTIDSVSSSSGTCNAGVPGDGALPTTCTFDTVPSGGSRTMQIVATVKPQTLGILGNNAKVYSDLFDSDNSDNLATTATTVEAETDLSITKADHPDPVLAGNYLTYDVTIHNTGPSTAVDVKLTDTLPNEVSFDGYIISNGSGTCVPLEGSTNVECDLNDLNPDEFVTVFIKVLVNTAVPNGTTITNEATVSSATTETDTSNNTAAENTTVNAEADLSITKSASILTDNPARRISYILKTTNSGPSDALNVEVVDELPLNPQKIIYVMDSGNGACTYDNGTHDVTCNFATLVSGKSVSVEIIVDARGSVDRITNTATVSSTTTDPVSSNNTAIKEIRLKGGPGKI